MKLAAFLFFGGILAAQSVPDFTGAWVPGRGGGTAAPPAATPLLLKSAAKAEFDAAKKKESEATARGEQWLPPGIQPCSSYGMPRMLQVASYPLEFIQTPKQITIIAEAFQEIRRVYIDKPQKPLDEVNPGYYGRSVGKWDGDTLVVDTIGISPDIRGYQGMPHSEKMHIVERIRKVTPDSLQIQVTIDDPEVLEKPVTYYHMYRLDKDYEMVEFVCDSSREYADEKGIVRMRMAQ